MGKQNKRFVGNNFILFLKTNFDNIFNGKVYVSTFVDDFKLIFKV